MNTDRECGCKGYRSCFICEAKHGIPKDEDASGLLSAGSRISEALTFCAGCESFQTAPHSSEECQGSTAANDPGLRVPGVILLKEFVSPDEESALLGDLDTLLAWEPSQSGRRKQNFGPRANFKKRKAKAGDVGLRFRGFPRCTAFVQDRFRQVDALRNYRAVEQCSIEYRPETGACIEPHIDDCWIWGERIVQLNLMSDSVLTLTPYRPKDTAKYNLHDVHRYPRILNDAGEVVHDPMTACDQEQPGCEPPYEFVDPASIPDAVLRIPLPRRSLLIMHGQLRYQWEHCILREDISARRVVIAYRELTPPYLPGGEHYQSLGREILDRAACFWDEFPPR